MRRRHSTKVRSSPQRRKSTSSACSVHLEHLDASVAQRDATIAAAQAFTRGRERSSADMSLFPPPPLPPTPSKASRSATSHIQDGKRKISREQSVRFVGPQSSRSKSERTTSSDQTGLGAGEDDETTLLATPATSGKAGETQAPRLRVLQSTENLRTAKGLGEKGQPLPGRTPAGGYLNTLSVGDEYYTPEDDIASAPSSYRRLRRSRSRSRLGQGSSTEAAADEPGVSYFANNSPDRRRLPVSSRTPGARGDGTDKENRLPPGRSRTPSLRAPKSMSFLRSGRPRATSSVSQDENSTSGYRTESSPIGPRRLRSQPSLFFRSRNKRPDVGPSSIRKSLRSNSSSSAVPVTLSRGPLPPSSTKDDSLRSRARKASRSLKSKLKSFFNLSKSENVSTGLPEQHIESQKTHVPGIIDSLQSIANGPGRVDIPDQCSLSRVPSNVASFHAVPADQRLRSRQGSLESLRSEKENGDEKSRVTSWSSGPTTIASQQQLQQTWSEWERQRLSVIKEHGIHSPSPSLRRPGASTPPVRGHDGAPSILPGPTIDSQRVYSALMKRLRETEQLAQISEQQRHSEDDYSDPFRTASLASEQGWSKNDAGTRSTPTPPTIRRVPPSCESLQDPRADEATFYSNPEGAISSTATDNPWADHQPKLGRKRSSSAATSVSYTPYPHAVAGDGRGLSPSIELVPRREVASPASSRAALSDRSSAFFASPTRHLFRTASPFRRALQESMHAVEHAIHSQNRALKDSPGHMMRRAASERADSQGSDVYNSAAYSDSVYSYHTRDRIPDSAKIRALVDEFPEPPSMLDDGNVFTDLPVYSPASHQPRSSASSVDWKTWLAANTAKLEPAFSPKQSEHIHGLEYVLPRMPNPLAHGHKRERAQICEDEDEEGRLLALPTPMPSLSVTPLSNAGSRRRRPTPAPRPAQNAVSPVMAAQPDQSVPRLGTPRRALEQAMIDSSELPPPIPPKSELRSKYSPSLASVRSGGRPTAHGQASQPQTPERSLPVTRSKSLARMRSLNQMHTLNTGSPQAPMSSRSKLPRRMGQTLGCSFESLTPSPGLTAAVERQFGSISQRVGSLTGDKENIRGGGDPENSPVCSPHDMRQDRDAQVMGSKRMVDLFLSSRRRRMVSTEESGAFI